jgi:hypothetical protein
MRRKFVFSILITLVATLYAAAQGELVQVPAADLTRVREFYRISVAIQDDVWPGWSSVPAPLLLVTEKAEFLTHHPSPPSKFKKVSQDWQARNRQFPLNFQATFPAFGPPSVIVIGEPANTISQTSTPWLFTLMHEHFHQLQNAQPEYLEGVKGLGLSNGDTTGMWMLNYPFPYEKPEVSQCFARLRDLLLEVLAERNSERFAKLADDYLVQRRKFFSLISANDRKYFSFQLWQEGIARYTEVTSAEVSGQFTPAPEFVLLPDYEPLAHYAERVRNQTLSELKQADLATWKRTVVYSFGAAEGFLLDRLHPGWKAEYFKKMFSLDSYFEQP